MDAMQIVMGRKNHNVVGLIIDLFEEISAEDMAGTVHTLVSASP